MSHKQTRNKKHLIGSIFGNVPAWFILSAATATGMFTTLPDQMGTPLNDPDQAGTEMMADIYAEHQQDFDALKDMKSQIQLFEAKASLGGNTDELDDLKTAFADKAVNTYTDLYLQGATADGAAISEEQFTELRTEFSKTIVSPETIGFKADIATGMLDEALADIDLKTATDVERFQTAKSLDQNMFQMEEDRFGVLFLTGLGSVVLSFLLFGLCAVTEQWQINEPKYNGPKTKSKKPGRYGQH